MKVNNDGSIKSFDNVLEALCYKFNWKGGTIHDALKHFYNIQDEKEKLDLALYVYSYYRTMKNTSFCDELLARAGVYGNIYVKRVL